MSPTTTGCRTPPRLPYFEHPNHGTRPTGKPEEPHQTNWITALSKCIELTGGVTKMTPSIAIAIPATIQKRHGHVLPDGATGETVKKLGQTDHVSGALPSGRNSAPVVSFCRIQLEET